MPLVNSFTRVSTISKLQVTQSEVMKLSGHRTRSVFDRYVWETRWSLYVRQLRWKKPDRHQVVALRLERGHGKVFEPPG